MVGLTYIHERVARLTGRLATIIFTTPMLAAMFNPMILTHLMTQYDDMWFVYVFVIEAIMAFIIFVSMHILTIRLAKARKKLNTKEVILLQAKGQPSDSNS